MKKILLLLLLGVTTTSMGMENDDKGTSCNAPKANLFLVIKPESDALTPKDEHPVFNAYYQSREFLEKKGYEELSFLSVSRNKAKAILIKKNHGMLQPLHLEIQYRKNKNYPEFSQSFFFSPYEYSLLGKRPDPGPFSNSSWRQIETSLHRMTGRNRNFLSDDYGRNLNQIIKDVHQDGLSKTFDRVIVVSKPSQTLLFYYLYGTEDEKEKGKILNTYLRR